MAGRAPSQPLPPTSAGWSPRQALLMLAGVKLQAATPTAAGHSSVAIDDSQIPDPARWNPAIRPPQSHHPEGHSPQRERVRQLPDLDSPGQLDGSIFTFGPLQLPG